MPNTIIYHNPRCSKSRQTLEIIRQKQIEPEIIEYLKVPPTVAELKSILKMLNLSARQLMRKNEADYTESKANDISLSDDALLALMVSHPKLIERPIVINKGQAVIGRPPESVVEIL